MGARPPRRVPLKGHAPESTKAGAASGRAALPRKVPYGLPRLLSATPPVRPFHAAAVFGHPALTPAKRQNWAPRTLRAAPCFLPSFAAAGHAAGGPTLRASPGPAAAPGIHALRRGGIHAPAANS